MARNGNTKILVVEDDQNLAELYAEWLGDRYVVETAYSGEGALEIFDAAVDIVLLDRMMPGLSGGEVLRQLGQYESNCQVVIVSAVTPDFDIVKMGFDAYLEKPVGAEDLEDVISQMLTRAEYSEDLQELFSLIERQSTLEAAMDATTLETNPKYQALTEQITELEDKVERYLQDLPDRDFRVAIERLQRTAAERREQQQYQSLTEDVLDTSQEGVVVVDRDGQVVWANETTEELLGVDRDDIQGADYSRIASESYREYHAGEQTLSDLVIHSLQHMSSQVEATVRVPETDSTEKHWLEYWSGPIQTGLYAGGRIEHYHDITERYAYEQQLEDLHAVSRELMTADSERSIGETVVAAAVGELGFEFAAIYTRQEHTGRLVPLTHAATEGVSEIDLPTVSEGDTPVWTAYVTRTEQLAPDDVADTRSSQWLPEELSSWRLYSLESNGLLLVGMTTMPEMPSRKTNLAKTLAANAASAFERTAQEAALQERDQRLKEQNERLTRLDRINTLIRSISATVISANTREELEREVCNALSQLDLVSGAWIGKKDMNTDTIEVRAKTESLTYQKLRADDDPTGYTTRGSGSQLSPAERAHRIERSVVESDLMSARSETGWKQAALKNGTNSIVAVPLQGEASPLGVLEVHSKLPNAFDEEEVTALTELGQIIGHGISALRQKAALLSGGGTTLEIQFADDAGLATLVSDIGTDLEVLNVVVDNPDTLLFARLTGEDVPAEAFEAAGFDPETVILSESRNGVYCKIPVRNSSVCEKLTDRGVAIDQITTASGSDQIVVSVTVPFTVDVGEYLRSLREDYGDLTLLSKLDSERRETDTLSARLEEALTTRQEEVLQTALYAGYFNWPRDADSTSVAKTLDIAQSTFNQHLRAAESNLLTALYRDSTSS